jgi:hypothetical protein
MVMKIVLQKFEPVVELGLIILKVEQVVIRPILVSCLEGFRFVFHNVFWLH